VKPVDAYVYHYGWVKDPRKMKEKLKKVHVYWEDSDDKITSEKRLAGDIFNFSEFDSLRRFEGTHPGVMKDRISEKNWHINLDISKKNFSAKEKLLYWYEKKTGKRLFDFRNYKII
jgi:hypothetical protein